MIIKMKKYPKVVEKQDVRDLFETYGDVKNVIMTPNAVFVNMPDKERAEIALNNLNGMKWKGWRINLKKFNSNEHTPICRTSLGMFRMF